MTSARARFRGLVRRRSSWPETLDAWWGRLLELLDSAPRHTRGLAAIGTGGAVGVVAGPVAGAIAAIYCAVALAAVTRRRWLAVVRRRRGELRHAVSLLAAELRAGADSAVAVPTALARLPQTADRVCERARDRLDAAVRIAEIVGAPISRILDDLAADLRAEAKVEATLSTHTAGSVASAHLLAALPVAGLGLGEAMGVDAVATLLYTPTGMVCAALAVGLQLAGLAWSRRIVASVVQGGGP